MEIREFDKNDPEQMAGLIDVMRVVSDRDTPGSDWPCLKRVEIGIREGDPDADVLNRLAWVDSRVVGFAGVRLPKRENKAKAEIRVQVLPEYRRRGIGRALADVALELGRDAGRSFATSGVTGPVEGGFDWTDTGSRFAESLDFTPALAIVLRRVTLSDVDVDAQERMLEDAKAKARGYEMVSWTGRSPDEYVSEVARLESRINSDIPSGDLEVEDTVFDVERLREQEARNEREGERRLTVAARHVATGALAGYTSVAVSPSKPRNSGVPITLVDPDHRSHGLGTYLKIEIQRALGSVFPEVRCITTGNAVVNAHMVAVNEKLGFKPIGRLEIYKREI